jgi:hypothetical protein
VSSEEKPVPKICIVEDPGEILVVSRKDLAEPGVPCLWTTGSLAGKGWYLHDAPGFQWRIVRDDRGELALVGLRTGRSRP